MWQDAPPVAHHERPLSLRERQPEAEAEYYERRREGAREPKPRITDGKMA